MVIWGWSTKGGFLAPSFSVSEEIFIVNNQLIFLSPACPDSLKQESEGPFSPNKMSILELLKVTEWSQKTSKITTICWTNTSSICTMTRIYRKRLLAPSRSLLALKMRWSTFGSIRADMARCRRANLMLRRILNTEVLVFRVEFNYLD